MTRTRPPARKAISSLADSRTGRTARTPWVPIVPETLSELFLSQLLRLVQPYDELLGSENHAVHGMHGSVS